MTKLEPPETAEAFLKLLVDEYVDDCGDWYPEAEELMRKRDALVRAAAVGEAMGELREWLEARRSSHLAQRDGAKSATVHNEFHELAGELSEVLSWIDDLLEAKGTGSDG